ncbi:folate-binding protein [Rhabdaerophilum sp. SD176]|uniref:CAF17-like 4Fe-4S cluster assembly/insertion protein YgfZ n=1 Tax=Rhabdaerophilum sp. SD176 TaxID=2983548 RepID=UPI0024DFE3A2|nr:folate-binding protein [Rhabdaerophilum sp. SD176]
MSETSPVPEPASRFACLLSDRAVLAVSGAEAAHFLHNLLTAEIEGLAIGKGVPAALLTPQGKIIADMLVFNASDDEPMYLIDVAAGLADDLVRRLTLYRLRSAVAIDQLGPEIGVAVIVGVPAPEGELHYGFDDPRDGKLGARLIGPREVLAALLPAGLATGEEAYHAARISLGLPECGKDYLALAAFPHEVNLDQLGGVAFRKGCYIGQEVVSRMEHRGTARTRTMIIEMLNGFNVMGGAECRAGDRVLGTGGECFGARGLVPMRIDRLEEALKAGEAITLGGVPVRVIRPGYARFSVEMG